MKKCKVVAGLLTILLMLSTICFVQMDASEVMASAGNNAFYVEKSLNIGQFKTKNDDGTITSTIPKASGEYADWIFAGWYRDEECTTAVGKNTVEGKFHAKFVPAEVLSIKCQTNEDISSTDDKAKIRVVSTVDSLKYSQVGFDLEFKGKKISYQTSNVLSGIQAATDGVKYDFSPNIFDVQSKYFITATIVNIENEDFDEGILMKPYWVTKDGTKVYGIERYARVEDSYMNILNVPVRLVSDNVTATEGTIALTYDNTKFNLEETYTGTIKDGVQTTTPGYVSGGVFDINATAEGGTVTVSASADSPKSTDGIIAHLRFKVKDSEVLSKINTFKIASTTFENVFAVDSVYHYYSTVYTGQTDTGWYDNRREGQTEFVITSPDELYGLAKLVNNGTFTTEKVYLGTDIKVNNTLFDENGSLVSDKSNLISWTPIGAQGKKNFIGSFDGQGHSIRGLYTDVSSATSNKFYAGLFGTIETTSKVKNFKIENSYFKASDYAGSVAGCLASGTIENIYSEAYVETSGTAAGGVVGISNGTGASSIEKCWFKGTVTAKSLICGGIVGVANGHNNTKNIINCLNEGDVIGTQWVGGLVGRVVDNGATIITNSLNMGNVSGNSVVGSVVGNKQSTCTINNVYALTADKAYAIGSDSANKEVTTFTNANKNTYYGYEALDVLRDKWDFDNTWVVRENNTPVLKAWCESGALHTPATSWAGGSGTEKDPYIIKTASQLYKLANDVNNGTTYDNTFFKLGANITVNSGTASAWETNAPKYNWITIGKQAEQHFKGSFDGANYTIKGLYIVDTSTAVGLFVDPDEVVLKNLKVTNSYLKGAAGTAAVVGWYGGGTFDSIYSDAIVVSTGAHGAGLVSLVDQADTTFTNCWFDGSLTTGDFSGGIVSCNTAKIQLTNCLNTGNIATTGTQVAGMVGRVGASVVMSDCLNTGAVTTGGNRASIVGYINAGTVEVERVYALTSSNTLTNGNINTGAGAALKGTIDKVEDVTGGNGYLNTYLPFDRPELPIPTTGEWVARKNNVPALKRLVSASDILPLDGNNMYRSDKRWLNEAGTETIGDVTYATYTIDTAEEFVGFSNHVTAGNDFSKSIVYLGKDIVLNKGTVDEWVKSDFAGLYKWSPIGTQASGKKFAGIFDGQGHTISGVYTNELDGSGLFGQIADGSKVTDFSLVNSCIVGRQGVGAICGWYGGGTFDTIYTNAKIIGNFGATSNSGHYGGFVGLVNANTKFKNCWFDGEMAIAGQYVGGIAGTIPNTGVQMTDCLNTGKMSCTFTGTDYQLGGLAGRVTQALTITDCLVACDEKIDVKSTAKNVGSVLGYVGAAGTNTNVYVLEKVYGNVTIGAGTTVAPTVSADLNGQNGYLNTYLTFDRPELPIPTTGAWVVRKDNVPGLKSFVSESDILPLDGSNMYRADKRWHDNPVVDENDVKTYTINTAEELIGLAELVNAGTSFSGEVVCLGADITVNTESMNANTNKDDVYQWTPIGTKGKKFDGAFDGKGYSISGLYTNITTVSGDGTANDNWYAGLFGTVNTTATIKDFSIKNSYFKANHYAGSVVGLLEAGTIENVYSEANVETRLTGAGGIVGAVKGIGACTVQKTWFKGTVNASSLVCGGIVGASGSPNAKEAQIVININNCLNEGIIKGTQWVGGLVGRIVDSETDITDCINVGAVTGTKEVGNAIGTIGSTCKTTNVYVLTSSNAVVGSGTASGTSEIFNAVEKLYDTALAGKLDASKWTFRVGNYPIPSSLADGIVTSSDYSVPAKKDAAYVIDTELSGSGTNNDPFLITSAAELYGFAALSQTQDFNGKTISLTNNITVNTEDTTTENKTFYEWIPIGDRSLPFAGTFNGNGNTISGLYRTHKTWESSWIGLFEMTADTSEINNFNIKNTYFAYTGTSDATRIGSVAGEGYGKFDSIYSDATLKSGGVGVGGILGVVVDAGNQAYITNCWYDGEIIGTRTGDAHLGGMIGFVYDGGVASVSHSLYSGKIHADLGRKIGGVVGYVNSGGTLNVTDTLITGEITGEQQVGIVAGRVKSSADASSTLRINTTWGVNDVVSLDVGSSENPVIEGKTHISTSKDRFIGMIPEYNSVTGVDETLASSPVAGTGFTGWVMMKNGTPVLKSFVRAGGIKTSADVYEYSNVVSALNPNGNYTDWFAELPKHKGDGTYQYIIEQQTNTLYTNYCDALANGAFTLYNSNTIEGVVNKIYTAKNDDLVVNVTFVPTNNTNTIYITVGTGQLLSEHLKSAVNYATRSNAVTDGYTLTGSNQLANVTFHMVEQVENLNGSGSSYIIQLKNGHFIVIDGGVNLQAPYLIDYMKSLVKEEGKKPIVEAWVVSHCHRDHIGVFQAICEDYYKTGDEKKDYAGQIYVNGIYFNEPSDALLTQYQYGDREYIGYLKRAAVLFKTSTNGTPDVYRMQTGQKYTFDDVTMDIVLSQDLLTKADYDATFDVNNCVQTDAINDTSTWCMFTIDNKKLLTAGDASYSGKNYMCDMYSKDYLTMDVMTALHHGFNTNLSYYSSMTRLSSGSTLQEEFSKHITVGSVVLYSYKHDMTKEETDVMYGESYAVNWKYAKLNSSFIEYLASKSTSFNSGISVSQDGSTTNRNYLYSGEGTSVLTFGNTITAELKTKISQ